jgi:hypothetical protein
MISQMENEQWHTKQSWFPLMTCRAETMINAAATLADSHDAHLIACYVIPAATIYPEVGFTASPAVDDTRHQYFTTNIPLVKERFETKL